MYQRIMVAVDGSDTSGRALQEAIRLGQEQGARLRIVHVVDTAALYAGQTDFIDVVELEKAFLEDGRQILAKAAASAAQAGIEADTSLVELDHASQRVADAVAAQAKAWPADLVVLGTHGRRGLSHLFVGSVAEGIVRVAPVPVLLVRAG